MKAYRHMTIVALAAVGLALAGCGGGGSSSTSEAPVVDPMPTAYETASAAIAAANSAAAAQKAVDDAAANVSGAQLIALQAAADARKDALATMADAAAQKMALTAAAGMVDTSDLSDQAMIDAAKAAIVRLEAALAAAADVSDADKAMYQGQVTAAEMAVAAAQSTLDHAAQTMDLAEAVTALEAIDLGDLSDEAKVDAAEAAITALQTALDMATELSAAEKAVAMTLVATANRTVMAAQGRMDVAGQKMALSDAVGALGAIDLDNLMTQAQIEAANRAIVALDLALAAADDLTDAEKLDALTDVTLAKRKVTAAETVLAGNVGGQRMALTEAGTALGAIDLADLDTAEKIAAANTAIAALKTALDGATHLSDAQKAMYQSQLDTATETVRTAQTGMDRDGRMMAQRTAITSAVTMARTAVAGVSDTSTDSEVASADAAVKAVKDAIAAAEDLSEDAAEIISAQAVLSVIEPQLAAAKTSRTTYMANKDEERGKTNAALGEAMHAALAGNDTADTTALNNAVVTWPDTDDTAGRLTITPEAGAGANAGTLDPVTFAATQASSAGVLGSWNGTHYADTEGTGDDLVTTEARVYTNKGAAETQPFSGTGGKYTLTDGTLAVADTPAARALVMAATFTHSGTQNHAIPEGRTWFAARGTYDGALGEFRCTTGPCSSTNDNAGSPSDLGGTWVFKPDTGAMVSKPDGHYLYYGWWVSKDNEGMPTAASAFAGRFGTEENNSADGLDPGWTGASTLTGSATYAGHAAGKFAINNPLDGTGDGGHFTADAELNAKFSGTTGVGITGTIDNFMANDKSVPWSVSLHRAAFGQDGAISAPVDDTSATAPAGVDESMGTTWSIDGNSGGRSGTWSGMMYDEKPDDAAATPPVKGDGSNIPTTVTGTFYSEFSTIGRMVGAFGANKQE